MNVRNMVSNKGNTIANQFIIEETDSDNFDEKGGYLGDFIKQETFQSYDSIIAVRTVWTKTTRVELDTDKWDYSPTTGKYRNLFLGETKAETEKKIKSGEYILTNLN